MKVEPQADDGHERLRDAIIQGRLLPSQRLVEAELSKTFGLSRATVRLALLRLEQEGLVERQRHRGATVRVIGHEEAVEIMEARTALEAVVAAKAAARATPQEVSALRGIVGEMRQSLEEGNLLAASDNNPVLHRKILEIASSRTLEHLLATLNSQIVRYQYRTILVPGRPEQSLAEHEGIVDAIACGDRDRAAGAMRQHLTQVVGALSRVAELSPQHAMRNGAGEAST
ncbi:MAG: GntR family transcriptional regulator [Candidatus Dormibacteraeota bacterium]|nr:GntR family transcriptional regulator [Candidatus Dormibacteraeota bacterium]MBO0704575.1 GntR family transcriptional regulator [Candidatus Dormibacteraeota bacterium]MBO0761047.1 GntR family transcriptional regulator [Candidatus Dormibacteraeota bacterium]